MKGKISLYKYIMLLSLLGEVNSGENFSNINLIDIF